MSVDVNTHLIEAAIEQADRLGIGFYYHKVEALIDSGNMEDLYALLFHMRMMDEHDESDHLRDMAEQLEVERERELEREWYEPED